MAETERSELERLVIYEAYVRNHTRQGTFSAIIPDLDRIQSMGVDIVWFMPIHPIGKKHHKGTLGCPYSISDYRSVNPEYGNLEDFQSLVDEIHAHGMKVMIDVVFNHAAHDSILAEKYPQFFHQDDHGHPVTTVPDWSDVIDLKHPQPELTNYLADCLSYWVSLGVDGFRCDVASLVPIEVWRDIKSKVESDCKHVLWLAESVHTGFITFRRSISLPAWSDSEIFQVFDLAYDYDIWPIFQAAVAGKVPVNRYLEMVRFQQAIYPQKAVKIHYVENHDQRRIAALAPSIEQAKAWTAFAAFNQGALLIYAGQESAASHTPSLFDREPIEWGNYAMQEFLTTCCQLKKHPLMGTNQLVINKAEPVIIAAYQSDGKTLIGIFNTQRVSGMIDTILPDGSYLDLLSNQTIHIHEGKMNAPMDACVFVISEQLELSPFFSPLIDTDIKPV